MAPASPPPALIVATGAVVPDSQPTVVADTGAEVPGNPHGATATGPTNPLSPLSAIAVRSVQQVIDRLALTEPRGAVVPPSRSPPNPGNNQAPARKRTTDVSNRRGPDRTQQLKTFQDAKDLPPPRNLTNVPTSRRVAVGAVVPRGPPRVAAAVHPDMAGGPTTTGAVVPAGLPPTGRIVAAGAEVPGQPTGATAAATPGIPGGRESGAVVPVSLPLRDARETEATSNTNQGGAEDRDDSSVEGPCTDASSQLASPVQRVGGPLEQQGNCDRIKDALADAVIDLSAELGIALPTNMADVKQFCDDWCPERNRKGTEQTLTYIGGSSQPAQPDPMGSAQAEVQSLSGPVA